MQIKRPRLALDDCPSASIVFSRISLTYLPIEILAEILLDTCSPLTVLAVSRTCSFLYRSLALNPDAAFIWRGVRRACKVPLHDPADGWRGSEANYAAFVFGGGVCEICRKNTRAMYVSFSARVRLCGSWHCRAKFLSECIVNICAELNGRDHQFLWVPPLESARCLYPSRLVAHSWPYGDILIRKGEWEAYRRELQVYRNAVQAQAEGKEDEETKRVLERYHAALRKFARIMEVCHSQNLSQMDRDVCTDLPSLDKVSKGLVEWKWRYDQEFKDMKKENETWTKYLAEREGWDLGLLIASQTYGSLQRRKNLLLEKIGMNDVNPIRSTIESELLEMRARRQHQKAEATYREKLTEVKKIYERMRCGTVGTVSTGSSGSTDPLVLPPLSVFCALPSVRVLKGSPNPSALSLASSSTSATSDINSPLAISLITADVHTWLVPVQTHLMTLLGYSNGWQSASTLAVHPLKRVTARFFCRRCGEGKVGRGYQRELCLDFQGVCSHVCKSIDGRHQEVLQESESGHGSGQDKGKSKGKKKSSNKTVDWKVDVFEKDEKAITLIKKMLDLARLSEDSPIINIAMKAIGPSIRCMTCNGWITMDFETAIGHAHRHEAMEIRILPTFLPNMAVIFKGPSETHQVIPYARLKFERGNTELLLGPLLRGKNLCKKANYGCKHCFIVSESMDTVVGIGKSGNKGARVMNFDGLRSHVKEKHGIQDIRDEDFFCYTSIQEGELTE